MPSLTVTTAPAEKTEADIITNAADLRVSIENHGSDIEQYTHVITNDMINSYLRSKYNKTLEDIILDPVTTTDGRTFTYQNGTQVQPNEEESYFEFECYFIATEDMWVHLTTEAAENIPGSEGTKVTSGSPSPQNEVVNCTRVDFTTDSNGTATFENNKGTQVTQLNTFDLPSGTMVYSDSTRLFHLDEMTPKKVTVRIWIEGEDPECDDDVQLAELTVAMSFIGCDDNNTPIA